MQRKTISRKVLLGWFLCCFCILPYTAIAQVSREQDWASRVQERQGVAALTANVFGDKISLYDGKGSFSVTDISIPGNSSLPVTIARKLELGNPANFFPEEMFGEWAIDLPYLTGLHGDQPAFYWATTGANGTKRCSIGVNPMSGTNRLTLPGGGGGALLRRTNTPKHVLPQIPNLSPWITKDNWYFTCLGTIKNGAGEGFVGISPDGIRYYFDWLTTHAYPGTTLPALTGEMQILRKDIRLYPTRVEDRFGNWVNYNWTAQGLESITSNDGRRIDLQYENGNVKRVIAHGQTYIYEYANAQRLSAAINPDGSRWSYDQQVPNLVPYKQEYERYNCRDTSWNICDERIKKEQVAFCSWSDYIVPGDSTFTITAPSGVVGRFKFRPMRHGRTWVPRECQFPEMESTGGVHWKGRSWNIYQAYYDTFSLVEKQVTGPALSQQTWTYVYTGLEPGFRPVDGSPYTPQYKFITILNPDGTTTVNTFGKDYGVNDGQLLWVDTFEGAVRKKRAGYTYVTETEAPGMPFPAAMGNVETTDDDADQWSLTAVRPQRNASVQQDDVTFTQTTNAYDLFARPLSVTKSSSLGYSKTDVTEYHDDLSKWVLGQAKRQYNAETDIVQAQTDYDANAMPWKTYRFGKLQQTLTYNADGTVATVTDGNGNTVTASNWKRGIPQLIQYPATPDQPGGASESAIVNDNGWITAVTDENGYSTGYGYDAMGRMASIVYPTGDSTTWNTTTQTFAPVTSAEYYGLPAGHWKQTVSTGNARKVTYFDALWRPLVAEQYDNADPANTRSLRVTRYDISGRPAYASYPLRTLADYAAVTQGTRTTYDALERPTRVEQDSELGVLATTTEYLAGFQTRVTNPRGQVTTTRYQAFDQPSYEAPVRITHPEGAYTTINRDTFGKPLWIARHTLDNSQWSGKFYSYDGYQQLCKRSELETGTTAMGYDGAGNLTWQASGLSWSAGANCDYTAANTSGRRVDRTYDARNRLKTLTFPDGNGNQNWSYTPDGLPASVTTRNDGGATSVVNAYNYNKRRLLDGQGDIVQQPGWYSWGIGYAYDANGSLAGQSYPTGLYIDYAPNALGQATRAGSYATGVSYFPNGAIQRFTYGNGIVHTMTQNTRQLPARSTDGVGVLDFAYGYDANANVGSITDYAQAGRQNRSMSYDNLDRLKTASSPMFGSDPLAEYGYDALDNLTRVKANGRDHTYVYDGAQRLTNVTDTVGGASVIGLGYDAQGNLANKNGQGYSFDFGNRLRSATNLETYRYDALGRRVQTTRPDGTLTLWQYSQAGQMLFSYDATRSSLRTHEYVYLAGSLVSIIDHDWPSNTVLATKYQHTDALGSPVAVTDASGAVIERSEYEPYGKLLNRPLTNGPGYTGHVSDAATGLSYMQQRYYDPGIGRFLSVDPINADGNTGAKFNRYAYALNNPYKFTDPDGRTELNPVMEGLFPQGDVFRTTGEAFGALAAYGVGVATGNETMQNVAIEGMRENVSASDGISAATMAVGPRGGGGKTSTSYTRTNGTTVYSGKTSGKGTPEQQVAARMKGPDHKAKTAEGYGPGVVDKNSANAGAIRGREQQLINQNGGAQSQGGTSGNKINSVSPTNPQREAYQKACTKEFGC